MNWSHPANPANQWINQKGHATLWIYSITLHYTPRKSTFIKPVALKVHKKYSCFIFYLLPLRQRYVNKFISSFTYLSTVSILIFHPFHFLLKNNQSPCELHVRYEKATNPLLSLSSASPCRTACVFAGPHGRGVVFPRYRDLHVSGTAPAMLPLRFL